MCVIFKARFEVKQTKNERKRKKKTKNMESVSTMWDEYVSIYLFNDWIAFLAAASKSSRKKNSNSWRNELRFIKNK